MSDQKSAQIPFRKHEVEEYERKRYRGLDQRLVHRRETRILRKIMRKIKAEERKGAQRVLDVPCGYGRFSKLLQDEEFTLISSDLSFHMVKRAVDRHDNPERIPGVAADAKLGLPFNPDTFFLLFSMRFFHHLHEREEREAVLREFARVTSGWVVLSYYQRIPLHVLQRKLRRRIMKKKTRIKMISRREFREEIASAGLQVYRIFPLFRGLHAHHIALLKIGVASQHSTFRN